MKESGDLFVRRVRRSFPVPAWALILASAGLSAAGAFVDARDDPPASDPPASAPRDRELVGPPAPMNPTTPRMVDKSKMSSFELIWGVFIDPEGDGSLVPDEARREVLIRLPGTPHIMSAEIGKSNAPRTAIPIRGDFEAKVRVTGTNNVGGHATTGDFPPYHGGGLIIHRDGANYLRLEIATDIHKGKHRHYSNFEYWRAGDLVFSRGVAAPTGTATLRIVRRGNEITAEFSPDGRRRHVFPILTAPLGEEVEVGLVAINSASKPLELRYSGLLIRPLEPAADLPPPAAPR